MRNTFLGCKTGKNLGDLHVKEAENEFTIASSLGKRSKKREVRHLQSERNGLKFSQSEGNIKVILVTGNEDKVANKTVLEKEIVDKSIKSSV